MSYKQSKFHIFMLIPKHSNHEHSNLNCFGSTFTSSKFFETFMCWPPFEKWQEMQSRSNIDIPFLHQRHHTPEIRPAAVNAQVSCHFALWLLAPAGFVFWLETVNL